jgi:hypothetical protein
MARTPPSRINRGKILRDLRAASRKGDRAALTLAVSEMRTLALSPRYWEKYLELLRNPLARLVDLLVIKQGDRIAHQKGWKRPRPASPRPAPAPARGAGGQGGQTRGSDGPARKARRPRGAGAPLQASLFES